MLEQSVSLGKGIGYSEASPTNAKKKKKKKKKKEKRKIRKLMDANRYGWSLCVRLCSGAGNEA
jgi:hypothetical protein